MRVAQSEPSFIPRDASIMVACPPGCIWGKVYFDCNELALSLRGRGWPSTFETVKAKLRCGVCGERPVEVREVTKLWNTKLAKLRCKLSSCHERS